VDDFSISEKDEDVKDYSGEDGGDGESDGDGEGEARKMTATMKDTAKTKKSR
jgi:hypothetical protein